MPERRHGDAIAGVDEAGRGPLAGPVVVAAVVLPDNHGLEGLDERRFVAVGLAVLVGHQKVAAQPHLPGH